MIKIESIKRWQWAAIGALAGLAIAYGQFSLWSETNVGLGEGKITQADFEREVRLSPVENKPVLIDIKIYPRYEHDRVELKRLVFTSKGGKYVPAFYIADRPYVPRGQDRSPHPNYSVRDFIDGTMPKDTGVKVEYAWWQARTARVVMGCVAGVAMIGGIWPMLLRVLVSAGYGRAAKKVEEKKVDLKPQKPVEKKEMSPEAIAKANAAREHLRELEEEMMRNLQSKTADTPAGQAAAAAVAAKKEEIRKLEGDDHVEPATRSEGEHDYRGEFYPVDRHAHPDKTHKD